MRVSWWNAAGVRRFTLGAERGSSDEHSCVVTGAGAGVGRAMVRAFAEHGCTVGLLARDADRLAVAAAEVEARGGRACAVPTDVADADAVEAAADQIERRPRADRRLGE